MVLSNVSIEIIEGQAKELVRPVDRCAFLIGSAPDCDLVLSDPAFPEVHAYLVMHNDGIVLRYLGAKPALTVNDRLVRSERLHDGDRIVTGPYEFLMHIDGPLRMTQPERTRRNRLSVDLTEEASAAELATCDAGVSELLRAIRTTLPHAAEPLHRIADLGDRSLDDNVAV